MLLTVDGIECTYDEHPALMDVSLSIKSHTVTGIIGPNGSGKSTLLRAMSRALRPKVGTCLLDGKDLYKMPGNRVARSISVVPQNGAPSFPFTVMEMVLMGRTPYLRRLEFERPEDIEISMRAMRRTGVLDYANRPVTTLSSGERQRVLIARALAQEPRVFLLDEPTSHLDMKYQVEIMDLISQLARQDGLACGVVLHDINLAARYCDELIMLESGRVYRSGTPWEVLTPDNIREVYGVEALVMKHPVFDCPLVIAVGAGGDKEGR
ncbi:MAG TPA: ABC transporter ATP-binding protein [Firmicutes bacterium]|nr:ABC transporter ATP-binding protein [Bacillota bacterium]HHY98090.1 ABC transporter ATP-binding protein [Bacillota bacterium]